jgi:hypothetical protein
VYEQAFSAYHVSQSESETISDWPYDWHGEDPSRMAVLREVVARNARYFGLLDEASRIPACAFPVDWRDAGSATRRDLTDMRRAARVLGLRAELLAADGDHDGALACISTAVGIADHVGLEPSTISQVSAYGMLDFTLGSLEAALSAGMPTAGACRRLFDRLGAPDLRAASVRALQAEVVLSGLPSFDELRASRLTRRDLTAMLKYVGSSGTFDGVVARLYPICGQHWINADTLAYLQVMEQSIRALQTPYPAMREMISAAEEAVDQKPVYETLVTRLIESPGTTWRAALWREKSVALIRAAQIALAATAYHAERGRYPTSLTDLEAAGWELPKDPFSFPESDFYYARDGSGFRVWSIGPDMDNDGGLAMGEDDYDITFRSQQ